MLGRWARRPSWLINASERVLGLVLVVPIQRPVGRRRRVASGGVDAGRCGSRGRARRHQIRSLVRELGRRRAAGAAATSVHGGHGDFDRGGDAATYSSGREGG